MFWPCASLGGGLKCWVTTAHCRLTVFWPCASPAYSTGVQAGMNRMNRIESNRIESNRIESNRIESNRIESNRIESNRIANRIESIANRINQSPIKGAAGTHRKRGSPRENAARSLSLCLSLFGFSVFVSFPFHEFEPISHPNLEMRFIGRYTPDCRHSSFPSHLGDKRGCWIRRCGLNRPSGSRERYFAS